MDLHYKQEITVGALVLIGVAAFVAGTMWLGGRSFFSRGTPTVTVQFPDAGTLKRGSPVKVSGVNLGSVEAIVFERPGRVLIKLSLDPIVKPRRDATAQLASVGIVADAIIKFDPGNSAEPLPTGTLLIGTVEKGFSEIGSDLSNQARQVMSGINEVQFKKISEDLSRSLNSFERLANTYSNRKTAAEVSATMESLQRVSGRLDSVLATAHFDRSLRSADSMISSLTKLSGEAQTTAKQLDAVLGKINRGEGTLGKLVSDTAFYAHAQQLLKSLQEFVDDLRKHPGKIGLTIRVF